ncbi:MAG: hypothetical protein R3D05_20300 [Dongiaceae bacterium]
MILTGYGTTRTAVAAIKHGAADYLPKPADADQVDSGAAGRQDRSPRRLNS